MPRPPRLHVEGGFYHVILRGNHREAIFFTPQRPRSIRLPGRGNHRALSHACACLLLDDQSRYLLMQVSDVPLGRAMLRIASRYARATQKRRPTTGHLVERRYRAILVDAHSYLA